MKLIKGATERVKALACEAILNLVVPDFNPEAGFCLAAFGAV